MRRESKVSIAAALLACSTGVFTTRAATPTIYQEAGGVVAVEAEHFSAREDGTDTDAHKWVLIPSENPGEGAIANARGNAYIQTLPQTGANFNSEPANLGKPWVDYIVSIGTAGKYTLYTRWNGAPGNNSIYAEIVEIKDGPGGAANWYRYGLPDATTSVDDFNRGWDANAAPEAVSGEGGDVPATWDLTPGTYTVRYHMREDGSTIDAFALQLSSLPAPGNPGPAESGTTTSFVKITTFPTAAAATVGSTATYTVVAEGTGTLTYQWQSKAPGAATFTDIAGATGASYTTPAATDAMNGTQYQVRVSNGTKTATSPAVSLNTDSVPPRVVQTSGGAGQDSVTVKFSEKLDKTSAETAANYTIAGLAVSGAKLDAAGTSVVLTTAKQTAGTSYNLSVTGVKDAAGNAMTTAGTGSFVGATLLPGKILARFYRNIAGTAVGNLTSASTYPNSPDDVMLLTEFSTPDGFGENYGAEVTGFFTPAATGNHKFYIRSDDASQLLLSTDSTEGGLRQVAAQGGCCNAFTDAPGTLSSQPIALEKGKPYFFKAFVKEGGGGDFLQVGVLGPNDADINDASAVVPIPADFLSTGFAKTASLSIAQQPTNITVQANSPATFTVGYNASSVFGTKATVQWQRAAAGSTAFTDIAGATNQSYTVQFPTAADNGAQFRAQLKVDITDPELGTSTTATSQAATLTVSGDVTAPTISSVTGGVGSIIVGFSEPLDAASAAAAANYKISGNVTVSKAEVISAAGAAGLVRVDLTGATPGQNYTVTVSGVKDAAGNTVASTTLPFDAYHIVNSFDSGVLPPGVVVVGSANLQNSGSYNGSGFLELTPAAGGLQGTVVFPEIAGATPVSKFTASWKMFIGRGSGNPADGVAFVLSPGLDDTTNFGEEGTGTGLILSIDTYDNGNAEAPAISLKYGGTSEELVADGGNTVVKTNVTKATLVNNQWIDVALQVAADGKATLIYNNVKYFDNVQIPGWTPIDNPRVAIGGRTGGELEAQWIDDVKVLFNADVALAQPPTIAITSPANDTKFPAGSAITLNVNAQAPGGTITKVEYFANGQSIGSTTTAPYSLIIPNVPESAYVVTARITDARGVTITSAPIRVIVGNPTKVLLVTADPGPLTFPGDQAVYDHLLQLGFDVELARGSDVPEDGSTANGKALIVQSSSLGSGTVETADPNGGPAIGKFRDLAIPAIEWEASSVDAYGFAEANPAAGTSDNTQINIVDASHPLAAGLPAGPVTVVNATATFSQSTPVGAHIIAQNVNDPTLAHIYYYDKGEKGFNNFVMPERRVFFFFQDNTAAAANDNGWKLFDAAVNWALRRTPPVTGNTTASITRSGNSITVSSSNGGTVEATDTLSPANWQAIGAAPQTVPANGRARFFRIRK